MITIYSSNRSDFFWIRWSERSGKGGGGSQGGKNMDIDFTKPVLQGFFFCPCHNVCKGICVVSKHYYQRLWKHNWRLMWDIIVRTNTEKIHPLSILI